MLELANNEGVNMQNYKTDILIVGTGASGLFAALHCPSDKIY